MTVENKGRRTRMSPAARRDQLIALGREMLRDRPLEQVSIDAIADAAGVSRALLFHYFESKQDFHVAIARAQAEEMLRLTAPDESHGDPMVILTASMSAFIDYVSDNPQAYAAVLRGAASVDPAMREVTDDTRSTMVDRILDYAPAFGFDADPAMRVGVMGWIAFVEEVTLSWLAEPTMSRERLLALFAGLLPSVGAMLTTDGARSGGSE